MSQYSFFNAETEKPEVVNYLDFDVDSEKQEIIKYLESITDCSVEVDGDRYILHPKTDITFVRTTTTIKGEL